MSNKHLSPHDRYVRSILSDKNVAREFLETHLPHEIVSGIDLTSLEIQKDSFIDDKLKLQIADLLYSVKFHGKPGYIYVLIEHASTPDPLLPYRMFRYMLSIIESHLKKTKGKRLPLVVPLVLYTGERPYNHSTDFFDLFEEERDLARSLYLKPFQLVDLGKIPDETLNNLFWFGAAGLITKHIKDSDILPILGNVLTLLKKIESIGQYDYINVSLSYIVEAGDIKDKEAFIETVKTHLETVDEDRIMTLADQWRQEGYQKGILQGMEKGVLQGIEKGMEKGMEKGKMEGKLEIARTLLSKGMSLDFVSSVTELSDQDLKRLMC